jgi:hypothetical protein
MKSRLMLMISLTMVAWSTAKPAELVETQAAWVPSRDCADAPGSNSGRRR